MSIRALRGHGRRILAATLRARHRARPGAEQLEALPNSRPIDRPTPDAAIAADEARERPALPAPIPAPGGGDNTIKVMVYLHTDGLAPDGMIVPGHARMAGLVLVKRNDPHQTTSGQHKFDRPADLLGAFEDACADAGVTLHLDRKAAKLYYT